jgi:predicted RNA-binding Zn-ribbon protein involved in translation (DUF1610 family)
MSAFSCKRAVVYRNKGMAEEKPERKPDGKGGAGKEKNESEGAEVAGRGKRVLYICPFCGAQNYVDSDWTWFVCWNCGSGGPEHPL